MLGTESVYYEAQGFGCHKNLKMYFIYIFTDRVNILQEFYCKSLKQPFC